MNMKINIPVLALSFMAGVTLGVYFNPEKTVIKEVVVEANVEPVEDIADFDYLKLDKEERLKAIADQIRKKREERRNRFPKGVVCQPAGFKIDPSHPSIRTYSIANRKLGDIGDTYSQLLGKEVMISGKAATTVISMNPRKRELPDVIFELEETFRIFGLKVTNIGESCVAITKI